MTLRLPRSMMRDLKLRAIDEERPVSEIVREAIARYIHAVGGAAAH
jgi:predicted DNA-binding protein